MNLFFLHLEENIPKDESSKNLVNSEEATYLSIDQQDSDEDSTRVRTLGRFGRLLGLGLAFGAGSIWGHRRPYGRHSYPIIGQDYYDYY